MFLFQCLLFFSPIEKRENLCNLQPNTKAFCITLWVDFYILFNFSLSWTLMWSRDSSLFTDLLLAPKILLHCKNAIHVHTYVDSCSISQVYTSFRFKSIVGIGVGAGAYVLAKFAVSHVMGFYSFFFFFCKYNFRRVCVCVCVNLTLFAFS